jgi:hypothetical protein
MRRIAGGVLVLGLLTSCGGGGDSTATTRPTVPLTAAALEAALLSAEDFDTSWTTEGPETVELGDGSRREGRCPTGDAFTVPDAAVGTDFESGGERRRWVAELLLAFPSPLDAAAWASAYESCVDETWEESDDPVEHVSVEPLDIAEAGDGASAVRLLYAHGEGEAPAHDEGVALIRLGNVLVVVSESGPDVASPYDQALLEESVAKAVSKAQATLEL